MTRPLPFSIHINPFSYPSRFTFCLLIILFFSGAKQLHAQPVVFDHITLEEGLSQSTVFSITQDAEGFMWFATREGLNRYDSRNIEIFLHRPNVKSSLSDNSVYCLYTDSSGRLWVGTRNGLDLYNPRTGDFTHFYHNPDKETTLSGNTIISILEDRHHNLWIGTREGLNLLPGGIADSLGFVRFLHDDQNTNTLVHNDVRSIYEDSEGLIWIGTSFGFSRLELRSRNDFSFTSFTSLGHAKQQEKSNWVNAIIEDTNGMLLVGTEKHGLKIFDKKKEEFISATWSESGLGSKAVRTILRNPNGDIWVGTIGGLYIIDHETRNAEKLTSDTENPYSLSDNSIRNIFIDRSGSCWIGTFHGGVNVYSPLAKQFQYIKPGTEGKNKLHFRIASALVTDPSGNLWMGTEGDGLLYIDHQKKATRYYKHSDKNPNSPSHDNIKCLLLEHNKGIWIGTIKGLDYFDFKKQTFSRFILRTPDNEIITDDAVYSLLKDKDENVWVGTYRGGLLRFNTSEKIFDKAYTDYDQSVSSSISSGSVTSLLIDSNDNLWVGTMSGLNKKTKGSDSFTRFLHLADSISIRGKYIQSIYEDTQKRIWIGTRENGVSLFSPDGTYVRHFTTDHGLSGNSVYGILEDNKGFLWLSTENGLTRFDARTFKCKNFDRNDGLISKQFNFNSYHKDDKGYMYFGGYNGVVLFHPEQIKENRDVPPLAFTRLRLFNKEVKPQPDKRAVLHQALNYTPTLQFRYDQNVFSVEFAVLNHINSHKNKYAYTLDGFEKHWNYVKEPVATYMNLRPGTYTLLVKGANNDGVWNDEPITLTLKVLPPPWKTWWAYTIYIAVFLSLLYAWSRLNKKQVQLEHELQLEHLENEKQHELHQAKLNFFTNVAHEIRTPLTLMIGPVDQLHDRLKQDTQLKKEIGLVKSNADRLMRLLNQLLDFQKHETGNVTLKVRQENFVEFIHEIIFPFQEFAQARKISLRVESSEAEIPLWFDRDELAKVFYNLLVNAFKFTPGGGEVCIKISKEPVSVNETNGGPGCVKVIVEDNGLGIPSQHLEKIFHRFYQAENNGIQEAGFGIGLSLTKGIIELHHGQITVESREATHDVHGHTRFVVLLKCDNLHFTKDELNIEELSSGLASSLLQSDDTENGTDNGIEPHEKQLILVVEDDDEIRSYIADTLQQHHYEVIECRNGYEGWQSAIEKLPNLILSDVLMNTMNGLDMVAKLKSDARTSHIPVILLTARASVNHQMEGLITGADDYIIKPFNVQLLLVKIKNLLAIREKLKEKYCKTVTLHPHVEEVEDPDDRFLQRLMEILENNLLDPEFNVTKLVREIGMSRPVLFRKIKMLTGLSVIDLIRSIRLKKAEMLLRQRKLSISEVAFAVGFNDPKYFSKSFREQYGKSPSQFMEEFRV